MAMSDAKLLEDLSERVARLEELVAELRPKEMQGELYGPEVDHTEDRNERAALAPRRGRPPGG